MNAPAPHPVRFADVYVLTPQRSRAFILSFLDRYLPRRSEYADTYEVPQFAAVPEVVFSTDTELMDYLELHPREVHAIYWFDPGEGATRAAMCLFTSDGQVMVGLTCETLYPDTATEQHLLGELMAFCGSTVGLIEYEKPAPKDTQELLGRIAAQRQGSGEGK